MEEEDSMPGDEQQNPSSSERQGNSMNDSQSNRQCFSPHESDQSSHFKQIKLSPIEQNAFRGDAKAFSNFRKF